MNQKTRIYFGPPLAILTENENNTMEISGKLNRTAERYMEILKFAKLDLGEAERACLTHICDFGYMSPLEIRELPDEVRLTKFDAEGLDKPALSEKLADASYAQLVAIVEELGF